MLQYFRIALPNVWILIGSLFLCLPAFAASGPNISVSCSAVTDDSYTAPASGTISRTGGVTVTLASGEAAQITLTSNGSPSLVYLTGDATASGPTSISITGPGTFNYTYTLDNATIRVRTTTCTTTTPPPPSTPTSKKSSSAGAVADVISNNPVFSPTGIGEGGSNLVTERLLLSDVYSDALSELEEAERKSSGIEGLRVGIKYSDLIKEIEKEEKEKEEKEKRILLNRYVAYKKSLPNIDKRIESMEKEIAELKDNSNFEEKILQLENIRDFLIEERIDTQERLREIKNEFKDLYNDDIEEELNRGLGLPSVIDQLEGVAELGYAPAKTNRYSSIPSPFVSNLVDSSDIQLSEQAFSSSFKLFENRTTTIQLSTGFATLLDSSNADRDGHAIQARIEVAHSLTSRMAVGAQLGVSGGEVNIGASSTTSNFLGAGVSASLGYRLTNSLVLAGTVFGEMTNVDISIGGASGDYDLFQYGGDLSLTGKIDLGSGVRLEPSSSLKVVASNRSDYTDSTNTLVAGADELLVRWSGDARFSKTFSLDEATALTPYVSAGGAYDLAKANNRAITNTVTVSDDRFNLSLGAGVVAKRVDGLEFSLGANAFGVTNDLTTLSVQGRVSKRF